MTAQINRRRALTVVAAVPAIIATMPPHVQDALHVLMEWKAGQEMR